MNNLVEYNRLKESLKDVQYAHRLGVLGYTVNLNWTTNTSLKSGSGVTKVVNIDIGTEILGLLTSYSESRNLPMSNFKSNTEILYRTIVALNSRIQQLVVNSKIKVSDTFSIDLTMGENYYLIKNEMEVN